MTDHGSQFYANKADSRKRGESKFEKRMVEMGIRQVLARVKYPRPSASWRKYTARSSAGARV